MAFVVYASTCGGCSFSRNGNMSNRLKVQNRRFSLLHDFRFVVAFCGGLGLPRALHSNHFEFILLSHSHIDHNPFSHVLFSGFSAASWRLWFSDLSHRSSFCRGSLLLNSLPIFEFGADNEEPTNQQAIKHPGTHTHTPKRSYAIRIFRRSKQ